MEQKTPLIQRILRSYRALPQKKQYIEFLTAVLTIPVLLTVIILNVSNLNENKKEAKAKTDEPKQIIVTIPSKSGTEDSKEDANDPSAPSITSQICNKELAPVAIDNPSEGENVKENPVIIDISEQSDEYCAVVWSYRINGGRWSEYDDKSIALYNPPKGDITFELRIKSLVTRAEKIITRKFTFSDNASDTSATPSATTN